MNFIVQKANGIVSNPVTGGTVSFASPTTPGNRIIIVFARATFFSEDFSPGQTLITDGTANKYHLATGQGASAANENGTRSYILVSLIPDVDLGGCDADFGAINSAQHISFTGFADPTPVNVWIYEILPTPVASCQCFYNDFVSTGDSPVCFNQPFFGSIATPSPVSPYCTDDGSNLGLDTTYQQLWISVIAPTSGTISGVSAVDNATSLPVSAVTLDTVQNGFAAAYAQGDTPGTIQATFVNSVSSTYCSAVVVFQSLASPPSPPEPPSSPGSYSYGGCQITLGTFSYTGKTPAINEGFFLSGFTGSLSFLNGQTVYVLSVDPSAHTFTADVTGPMPLPPSNEAPVPIPLVPEVNPPVTPSIEDMLDWVMIGYPQRTTQHLTGSGNPAYNWKDTDGQKVWLIKNPAGHPWDIYVYDTSFIKHWITENGDQGQFNNASAYKQFSSPVPVIKRFFDTNGGAFTVGTPGPNSLVRTVNCGVDAQPLINLGDVRGVTNPPVITTWTGLGTFPTIRVDYYYGGTFTTTFHQREQFFYVKGLGLVQWDHAFLMNGNYAIDQTTTKTGISNGGCPTPVFLCYPITGWIGGPPGGINAP